MLITAPPPELVSKKLARLPTRARMFVLRLRDIPKTKGLLKDILQDRSLETSRLGLLEMDLTLAAERPHRSEILSLKAQRAKHLDQQRGRWWSCPGPDHEWIWITLRRRPPCSRPPLHALYTQICTHRLSHHLPVSCYCGGSMIH